MKYFSAFTGVGGFDMGMPEGWECVGHSEVDKYANMVLRYRYKDVKNYGNAEKIDWKEVPNFDVFAGGTPCQDLSVSGKRAGLNGSRSRLFFEFVRAIKEKKPQYFIWENVKGALSSNGGWDFARVLLEFSQAGYSLWWEVLDATWFGIPQHRERVFVVGTLRGKPESRIFLKPKSSKSSPDLSGQTTNTIRKRYRGGEATGSYIIESELNAQNRLSAVIQSKKQYARVYDSNGISPTLHRHTGGGQITKIAIPVLTPNREEKRQNGRRMKDDGEPVFTLTKADRNGIYDGRRIRYLTPLECERLMGWPDNWTAHGIDEKGNTVEMSDNQRYNLIGNGVVPQVVSGIIKEALK